MYRVQLYEYRYGTVRYWPYYSTVPYRYYGTTTGAPVNFTL
eukprot:COSAG01_NODE_7169_length_3320_cov_4.520646_1_plen_41_part_00